VQFNYALGIRRATIKLVTESAACNESTRGSFKIVKGGDGQSDAVYVCLKESDGTYHWLRLGDWWILK